MEEIFSISEDGKELLKCSPQAMGLIKIPEGIETIKCNAFENCCDIEGVVIPSSVNEIEQNAFYNCINLKTISIPDSINVIPTRCFENCKNLRVVAIQSDHIEINPTAFLQCSNITRLYLAKNNPNVVISSFGDSENIKIISPISDYDRIKSSVSISAEDLYKTHATNLKYMALFYKYMGMNITQMKWSKSLKNAKSFKEPINTNWETYKTIEQSIEELFSINWDYSAGLGLVLGYNNYRALDFDINGDFLRKERLKRQKIAK